MRPGLIAFLLALTCVCVRAEPMREVQTGPSPLTCLEKTGPAIDYPVADRRRQVPGFVRLRLEFKAPDRPPQMSVLFRAASDDMLEEVTWHVRGYRLPCLPQGQTVTAVQEFEFNPRDLTSVTWTDLRDVPERRVAGTEQRRPESCMTTPRTEIALWDPQAPDGVVNVVVELSFSAPNTEPAVQVRYASAPQAQVQRVLDHVRQYRMSCPSPDRKPFVVQQQFSYRHAHVETWAFKDALPLKKFLASIKGIRQARADFDFKTMNCPFQVAWTVGKPAMDNWVGEVGEPDLNRAEFLAWLGRLEMNLSGQAFEQMLGQTVIVDVPCGTLKLAPSS